MLSHAEAVKYAEDQARAFQIDSAKVCYEFSPDLAKEALKKRKKDAK